MAKHSDPDDWEERKGQIIGLGERSFRKSYYPQLRENLDRLQRFRILLDRSTDIVVLLSVPEGIVVDANEALGQLLNCNSNDLIGAFFPSLGLGDASRIKRILEEDACSAAKEVMVQSHSMLCEYPCDQDSRWLEMTLRTTLLDGECYCILVARDVSERQKAHAMVEALLAEKEALLDNALVGIAHTQERTIVSCNRRFEELFGYLPGELLNKSTRILYESDIDYERVGSDGYAGLGVIGVCPRILELRRKDGSLFWTELTGRALGTDGRDSDCIWVFSDITERRKAEEKARFLQYHDVLTGLPNHQLFHDRLQQAMAFCNRAGKKVAVLLVDLDRFKSINDLLGHEVGDQFLVEVAKRLESNVRSADTVSRQGGDEFMLLLSNVSDLDAIAAFARDLMFRLEQPFEAGGQELTTSASIGIAIFPEDGADYGALLKKAEIAMYRAKESGRNAYRFFNEEMNHETLAQASLYSGMRRALASGQFVLHFQPQIEIASGRLLGAEALIRWNHPELGLVYPGRFIKVAEDTGLIVEIGQWVLEEACREAARWTEAGFCDLTVAVNLSSVQFKRGDVEKNVAFALESSGLAPSLLELELTESILIDDTDNVLATVKRLKLMGITLSIDDFGTGYSSLSYLKRFDVDKLKIDQSFVSNLASDDENIEIVRAIIQMAGGLGLKTIAEGVETRPTKELLQRYGCDEAQGYLFARPLSAPEFIEFARATSGLEVCRDC